MEKEIIGKVSNRSKVGFWTKQAGGRVFERGKSWTLPGYKLSVSGRSRGAHCPVRARNGRDIDGYALLDSYPTLDTRVYVLTAICIRDYTSRPDQIATGPGLVLSLCTCPRFKGLSVNRGLGCARWFALVRGYMVMNIGEGGDWSLEEGKRNEEREIYEEKRKNNLSEGIVVNIRGIFRVECFLRVK